MNKKLFTVSLLALFIVLDACKKDDPEPLQAEVKGNLLAGEKGKSKNWLLIEMKVKVGSNEQTLTLDPPYLDNIYTFYNNDGQDYESTEGASKYDPSDPNLIEKGTWSFTLDGLFVNIGVDETYSINGLFSPDAMVVFLDDDGNPDFFRFTYPYPTVVTTLTETSLVLESNVKVGSGTARYTFTFTAQ